MKTINLCSIHPVPWLRQFPNSIPEWDGWKFIFNAEDESCDYLVVFDNLRAPVKPNCPKENIIHLATEPPSLRCYGEVFLKQFSWVITQDPAVRKSGKILHQPGIPWFIGWQPGDPDNNKAMSFDELAGVFDQPKSKLISVIASNKAYSLGHKVRLKFAQQLKEYYGDKIDFYGRGFVSMDDKLDSLKDYRFQVVLENSVHNHYFSEKFTDCVLAGTYPIYHGCPNLGDYFPENSYLKIDINDFQRSVAAIDQAIEQKFDQKYREALLRARDQTLYEHNLFPMLISLIERIENGDLGKPNTNIFYGKEILPFRLRKFPTLFGREVKIPFRTQLKNLAHKNALFGLLHREFVRRRMTVTKNNAS